MIRELAASGPFPDYAERLGLYGQFVGSWNVHNRYYDEADGRWHEIAMRWHFGWVLGGRAVQDVLTGPTSSGTSVRVYDPDIDAWRVHWFGPAGRNFCTLIGRADGAGIVQLGTQVDGRDLKWTFTNITRDSFTWQGFISDDGGHTWVREQDMQAKRV